MQDVVSDTHKVGSDVQAMGEEMVSAVKAAAGSS